MNQATLTALNEIKASIGTCNTINDVRNLVKSVLKISKTHPLYNKIVNTIWNSIDSETVVDKVIEYLEKMRFDGMGIRPYTDSADIESFAEACVEKYMVLRKLSMAQFKKIAYNFGFVIGPKIKTTRILTAIIDKNIEK